jgi:UDP-GlcNAc:undecaprenyl-phosphate/decaprenyl-phosphate GlcNAc-1-phosphate transferase
MTQSALLFRLALALVLGFAFAYVMIPSIIRLATRLRILDFPSDARRIHQKAVPRLGGVAVFLSVALALITLSLLGDVQGVDGIATDELLPLGIAVSIVFITGLIDDIKGVRPRWKVLAQVSAALIIVSATNSIVPHSLVFATGFGSVSLGIFAAPLTIFWIVGVTNAFNLIDGMDGLAGTAALIGMAVCIGLDVFTSTSQSPELMLAAAGAVVAFLAFNGHPARIFLGDSGSMLLGFLLSVRLLASSTGIDGSTYFLVPLFALALPLMDTAIAIARRWLRGDRFSEADGRHIHHQILALGVSPRVTIELLGFFFAAIAVLGISIAFAPARFTLALMLGTSALLFVTFWYGLRWLRYHEFQALGDSMASAMRNARRVIQEKIHTDEVVERLGKAASFAEVQDIVASLVSETRVLDIEVFESTLDLRSHGPSRQRISTFDALPVRFDYPFTLHEIKGRKEMVLRIWSPRPSAVSPIYTAERVASRIGPALEAWFNSHDATSTVAAEDMDQTAERHASVRLTAERPSVRP